MSNNKKKFTDFENPMEAFELFTRMMSDPGFGSFFGGGGIFEEKEKYPYERLGDGYELRPIELTEEEIKNPRISDLKYCNLYHNDLKVSDLIFRKGGMNNGFKDGYCPLIVYTRTNEKGKNDSGFSFGIHVIVNRLGEICLSAKGISEYPSHQGGNVGKLKDTYYNLLTGEPILTCSSSGSIDSKNFIFVEHRYDWYSKDLPLGIYRINKADCTFTKIDDIK